ncbi:MAG: N-acetylglucosamine-6-sulfatase [Solirubrobacterales bacterium]|jgi:arylsulfatase A-like enzyme|nr:N-acetylglucosamine-6-sulfatase [Solirubrobacterales bacterium]
MDATVRRNRLSGAVALTALAAALTLGLTANAGARPTSADTDGRPNILVVMTDDMSAADLKLMPNVRKLLAKKGTTFDDAVDSFPLCCPARATFITGQYAHNHGVKGNFAPYGWYGMKDRKNILPAWLDDAGYDTALIGKWLNGYGALDAHGEIPNGFDTWRGLLDVSAYDYSNFVMNMDGKLKAWGDKDFARKLVQFAIIEVDDQPDSLGSIMAKLQELFGPAPYTYWGAPTTQSYSPDVTGKITEGLVKDGRKSRKPFFIWWAPAAPHREDVATTLMGRPGPDPRPPPRYEQKSTGYTLPRPPNFNEADTSDKSANFQAKAPSLSDAQIAQLQLDYEGRAGSMLAVDDHVGNLVEILKETDQLDNTEIVFVSDNGWLEGEHRIPGDKFLPYEEALKVPLVIRGPGVPKNQTVHGQVSNIDFAPTLLDMADAKAGRKMDGVSLLPTIRNPNKRPKRAIEIEALAPLFASPSIPVNGWDRPYTGVRTDRYTYVVWTETGEKELYDRQTDPYELDNLAGDPSYAAVESGLAAKLAKLQDCAGKSCQVKE